VVDGSEMNNHDKEEKNIGNQDNRNVNDNMLINYISSSAKIGKKVNIGYFSYVGRDTEISDNVMIGSLSHILTIQSK
jgi:acyl-[acyl carrier protein]--UDP-N-acetylglucosamine O-acyltransferase